MKRKLLAEKLRTAAILVVLLCIGYAARSQAPANDFCTNAITITCGAEVDGDTGLATSDWNIAPSCGGNLVDEDSRGIWYHFVGTGDRIILSTCGMADYDTSIAVFTGSCSTGLICVAGNDDGDDCADFSSLVSFNSVANEDYLILVDGYEDDYGEFTLTVTCETPAPVPANDVCSLALPIPINGIGEGVPTGGTTEGANPFTGRFECDEYATVMDVWYSFNSDENKNIRVNLTAVSAGRVGLAIFKNSCTGLQIFCSDEFEGYAYIGVEPGANYYMMVYSSVETGTFNISLEQSNYPAEINSPESFSISRYLEIGDEVLKLSWNDDEGDDQVFTITEGNDAGIFAIDNQGVITIANAEALLDTELSPGFEAVLTVQAADQGVGNLTSTTSLSIDFIDNHRPVIEAQSVVVSAVESFNDDGYITTLAASDEDEDDFSFYSNAVSGDDYSIFYIAENGEVYISTGFLGELIYEQPENLKKQFVIEVQIADESGLYSSEFISIDLTGNNQPFIEDHEYNLSLYAENGKRVGEIEFDGIALDLFLGQIHSVEIIGGNDDNIFSINDEGEIIVSDAAALLANGATTYNLAIQVTDSGTPALSDEATYTINVIDGHAPVLTSLSFSVDENAFQEDLVGALEATDEEEDFFSMELLSSQPTNDFFEYENQLYVTDYKSNQPLDFETKPVYELEIEVTDETGLSSRATVSIQINNVDEGPVFAGENYFKGNYYFKLPTAAQNGAIVGNLNLIDPDGDPITYFIDEGNEDGVFSVDASGNILVADASLFNVIESPVHEFIVGVESTTFTNFATVVVELFANNDFPSLTITDFYINENEGEYDILVGVLSGNDSNGIFYIELEDSESEEEFELAASTEEESYDFGIEDNGLYLIGAPFDHEVVQQIQVNIRVVDFGPGQLEKIETVTVHIMDINEFDPVFDAPVVNALDENSAVGTVGATVNATDKDITQTLTYSIISGNTNDAFAISNDGTITVANQAAIDFETNPTFTLTIRATDNVAPIRTAEQQVIINVFNVNDVPVISTNTGLAVSQGESQTITSSQLSVTDQDNSAAQLVFTVTAVPANGKLKKANAEVAVNGTFTQADVNAGQISYDHDGFNGATDKFTFTVADGNGGTIAATDFNITIDIITGLEPTATIQGLSVFPSPAEQSTTIRLTNKYRGQVELRLTDLTGRSLQSMSTDKTEETIEVPVNLSGSPRGVLILQVSTGDLLSAVRIIKK